MNNVGNRGQQFEKLLRIEKKSAFKSGLRTGVLAGILSVILAIVLLISLAILFRRPLQKKFLNTVVSSTAEQIFSSFPDGYYTHNRNRVMQALDDFANAAADHRLTKEDYSRIARMIIQDLQDKRLTYQELTDLVNKISELSNKK